MKPVHRLKILGLEISGFKGFETASYSFGDVTCLMAGNGRGKTSIADAIAYTLTGYTYFGGQELDRLYHDGGQELFVRLTIECDGQQHELARRRRQDKTSIALDGVNIRQAELTSLFGDKDVFLSIFNPLYFVEALGSGGKMLLEKRLPAATHEQVLAGLSEPEQALLKDVAILSPEEYAASLREELRKLDKQLIAARAQQELAGQQKETQQAELEQTRLRLQKLQQLAAGLEDRKREGIPYTGMQQKAQSLAEQYRDMLACEPQPPDFSQLDRQIQAKERAAQDIRSRVYESAYRQKLEQAETELKVAAEREKQLGSILTRLRPGLRCSHCSHTITAENLEESREGLSAQLKAEREKAATLTKQLQALREIDDKAREKFLQGQKDDLQRLSAALQSQKQKRQEAQKDYEEKISQYHQRMQDLYEQGLQAKADVTRGKLSVDEAQALSGLYASIQEAQAKLKLLEESGLDATLASYTLLLEQLETERKDKVLLLSAVNNYGARRTELMLGNLRLDKVRIQLTELVKSTGELKDTFKITYAGREYRKLSLAERTWAGLELSAMLSALEGREYPIFVDNAESLEKLPPQKGQLLFARMSANQPLSIRSHSHAAQLRRAG